MRFTNNTRAILPLLMGFILGPGLSLVASALTGPAVTHPTRDEQTVFTITKQATPQNTLQNSLLATTPEQHIARAKQALLDFQRSANPRFLGNAQRELAGVLAADYSADFYLYRASLRQSLHQFSAASADLAVLGKLQPNNFHAHMMRFTIAFVSGDEAGAELACQTLAKVNDDLYAASCRQLLRAAHAEELGEIEAAYRTLKTAMAKAGPLADRQALSWASGSLADIAERAGRDDAAQLWQLVLSMNPDDVYARARLAALKLAANDDAAVLILTKAYLAVDSLAVLNAIAARRQGGGEQIISLLRERFNEALWRGEVLHKRAYAQFLLDIESKPAAALMWAKNNWQEQREWPDTQLLARAKRAVAQAENSQ
ncbi:MAG: hypothetical protein P1U47_02390 [Zhongshania sp.]|uniref:tetratricopeptide repeat protein n=1 Tax=Zhongshania sp. TaxID=1971902 RepID=UPI00262CD033|nr:hypothetical protein [Zhongshania sp.]MDF1691195.1 hypothetical protein [Zhongshania sp.]